MTQGMVLTLFLFCLLTNVGLWLMGGWLVTEDIKDIGVLLFAGAGIHSWLVWEAFVSE